MHSPEEFVSPIYRRKAHRINTFGNDVKMQNGFKIF